MSVRVSATRIRPATSDDLPGIAAIERVAFEVAWDVASLADWLSPSRGLLLVEEGSAPTGPDGYALFQLAPGEADLLRIATATARLRTGVARRLLAAGLERLAREGRPVVTLEVRRDNVPAIALYERFSFVRVGVRKAYYSDGCDAFVYRRDAGREGPDPGGSPAG